MMKRRFAATVMATLVIFGASLAGAGAAEAKRPSPSPTPSPTPTPATSLYLAVGDSYAAGTGLTPYSDTLCYRSQSQAYPSLLASSRNLSLTFRACSGATTQTLRDTQLTTLAGVSYVSVTIGGNDIGFANILSDCTASALTDGCSAGIRTTTATALGALGAKLVTTVAAIKDTYPGATVLVTGYPVMFGDNPPTRCTVGNYKGFYPLWINKTDAIWLNEVAVELNGVIKDAAGRSGATYVDVQKTFDTHGRCDTSTAWVNGVILKSLVPTVASEASFHPTATGQSGGYAAAFPTPLP